MEDLEEIYKASEIGYSKKVCSIVDSLLEARWITKDSLVDSFDWLDKQCERKAICFFQLPFPVLLPNKDIYYDLSDIEIPNPLINFELIGSDVNKIINGHEFIINHRKRYTDHDNYINAKLKNEKIGLVNNTQVMIKYTPWRFWDVCQNQYYDAIYNDRDTKKLIYKNSNGDKDYYIDHNGVAINAGKFEYDLAVRLRTESLIIINKILKIYAVACRHSVPYDLEELNNFFVMMHGGRIVTLGQGRSMATKEIEALEINRIDDNYRLLNRFLNSCRDISVYEEYLLYAIDLLEHGSPNLSVAYVSMILEWFSNEIIDEKFKRKITEHKFDEKFADLCMKRMWKNSNSTTVGRKVTVKDRFTKYFPALGINIPPSMLNSICDIINKRNSIVHGIQSTVITREDSLKAIDDANIFIDFIMTELINN